MKVTVIIPTSEDRIHYLDQCVTSLRATTDWDVIVVSTGGETAPDYRGLTGISRHLHTRDEGEAVALKIAAQVVPPTTNYIFYTPDEMYYAPDWNKNLRFKFPVFSPRLIETIGSTSADKSVLNMVGGASPERFEQQDVDDFVTLRTGLDEGQSEPGFNLPCFIRKDIWDKLGSYKDFQKELEALGAQPKRLRDVLAYHFTA